MIERPDPLPMPVLVERDDDRGAAELFLQPPGDDADHAGMPAAPGDDARPRDCPCAARSASAASCTLASIARRSSLSRSSSAAMRAASAGSAVVSRRTPRSDLPTRPPALMRGPSAKPRSVQVGARVSRDASISAARPMLRRCAITLSPCATKARLRPLQLRDIGDGAERDDIEQVEQARLGAVGEPAARAQRPDQRRAEQEGDADRGEMAVRRALALVEPVGIDQRMGDGAARSAHL